MRIVYALTTAILLGFSSCESCQRSKEIKERRESLAQNLKEKLQEAKNDLATADSISSVLGFKVDDYENTLVFEKNEKYQARGYWVVPEHAGDKKSFTFFPEVEEEGQMLLVSINEKREWSFYKVKRGDKNFLKNKEVKEFIGRELTEDEINFANICYDFSETMNSFKDSQAAIQKNKLKVEYYEKKIADRINSLD